MTKNNKKGFTIIEVVLVLAIAGLIFLMVFIALPALQRSQRNTRRRQDLSRFQAATEDYRTNNNGRVPITKESSDLNFDKSFVKKYIDEECPAMVNSGPLYLGEGTTCGEKFRDPDGSIYNMFAKEVSSRQEFTKSNYRTSTGDHPVIIFAWKANCADEEGFVEPTGNSNDYALLMMLEGGSVACQDNK